jgi:hypothetical protein
VKNLRIFYLGKRKTKKQRPYWGVVVDRQEKKGIIYIWRFAFVLPLVE